MESLWTALRHIKTILLWAVALTALVAAVASAETVRDWVATSPQKFAGLESAYQQTAAQVATNCRGLQQSTIDGLRTEIRKITTDKVGAKPEVVAVLLALEQSVHKLMATAETEKAKC